ncbi:putative nucleic acid-binding Zn-ribbon protein [Bradyrhizobium elkanii]
MERLRRIQELLKQKREIGHELDEIRQQVKAEKAAFSIAKKPQQKKQGELEHFSITLRRNQPRRDNFDIPRVRSV